MINLKSDVDVVLLSQCGSDHEIASAARVSIGKETDDVSGLIGYLMKMRHGSPFEHGYMSFHVHAPIFVFREWHRHRIGWSYNELSARYAKLDPVFWVPNISRKVLPTEKHKPARPDFTEAEEEVISLIEATMKNSYMADWQAYERLIEAGVANEVSRSVLPVGIYSSCRVTCNPRSMMHFLSLRTYDENARFVSYPQAEIEEAARKCEAIFANHWPVTYKHFCEKGKVAP